MYKLINFTIKGNYEGNLVPIEGKQDIPFDIKRVYYIWGTKFDAVRGNHAHRKLEQIIICIAGSCDFILDDGNHRETVHLSSPNQGIYIKHDIWREFTNFSKDCIVLVLASEHYNELDYIRNYDQFKQEIIKQKKKKKLMS